MITETLTPFYMELLVANTWKDGCVVVIYERVVFTELLHRPEARCPVLANRVANYVQ